jgi:hypothetical protein
MSRLRRLVVSDGFFFVTCRLLPRRGKLQGSEFERGGQRASHSAHRSDTAASRCPDTDLNEKPQSPNSRDSALLVVGDIRNKFRQEPSGYDLAQPHEQQRVP